MDLLDAASPSGSVEGQREHIARVEAFSLTPDGHAFLRIFEAQLAAHLGDGTQAMEQLDQVESELDQRRESRSERVEAILTGSYASARGLAQCALNRDEDALAHYEVALDCYRATGLTWRVSGVLLNTAIATGMSGNPSEGLSLLDEAEVEAQRADVPDAWRAARWGTIGINRSGLRHALGDVEGSVEDLITARPHVLESGDRLTLGHVDFNLAILYLQLGRFGSGLEAGRASAENYRVAGSEEYHRKATITVAKALAKLGRFGEADDLLQGFLRVMREDGIGKSLEAEALGALEDVYRGQNRVAEADRLLQLRIEKESNPNAEERALNTIMLELFAAMDLLTRGGRPVRSTALLEALDALLGSKHKHGPRLGRLMGQLVDALFEGRAPAPLTDKERQYLRDVGQIPESWEDLAELALGLRNGDDERTLQGNLRDLVRLQEQIAVQEGPGNRSHLLATRGGSTLDASLTILLRRLDYEAVFELIEWCRREQGDDVRPDPPYDLASYDQLTTGSEDEVTRTTLSSPAGLSIGGRSEMARVYPQLPIAADAHELRCDLVGDDGAWWTTMLHRGELFWGLLTPDGASAGRIPWPETARAALLHHFEALPLPMAADAGLLESDCPEWCTDLIAMARAAQGPLLAAPELLGRCLAALPPGVAARMAVREPSPSFTLNDIYGSLGDVLVPPALNDFLDRCGADAKLLVSVQPELASVPTCLLRTANGQVLAERASIAYAPPVKIAARLVERPRQTGLAEGLIVVNPTGDLSPSRRRPHAHDLLQGWGEAPGEEAVATVENFERAIRALAGCERPGLLSFAGHIRSGAPSDPGEAALALAPGTLGGKTTFLSARELGSRDIPVPSRVYLGGCEGAGFSRGLEWSSVAAAALGQGASHVLAHRWPIVDALEADVVDRACADALLESDAVAAGVRRLVGDWLDDWRRKVPGAVSPHYWAGLQTIGRA